MTEAFAQYLKDACKEFCRGTGLVTPADVVEKNLKTLTDWCLMLDKHRLKSSNSRIQGRL